MLVYVCAHILLFFLFTGLIPVYTFLREWVSYRNPRIVTVSPMPSEAMVTILSLGWFHRNMACEKIVSDGIQTVQNIEL